MAPVLANSDYIIGAKENSDGSVSCWGAVKGTGMPMEANAFFE